MRLYLLFILLSITLTSCVYYGDIHGDSHRLTVSDLSVPHVYTPPKAPVHVIWWNKFKDPQLSQLISVALSDSPTMQIAETRVRRAQHLAEEVASSLWPTVDFSGYVQRQRFSTYGLVPPPFNGHTYNIGTLGLNFNYEFDFWGKNRQLLLAKLNEKSAAEAERAQARLIVSAAVATAYFQLRSYHAQAQIARADWLLNKQILRIAASRTKQGVNSSIPVKTIEAAMQTAKLTLERYRYAEKLSCSQLAVLLGKNPFTTHIDTRPFVFHEDRLTLPASLPASLLAQRPDIYAAKARAQAAANQINVAKTRFFPNINLNVLYSYQSVGLGHLFDTLSQNNGVTGAIDLPIFDAGARRADLGVKYAEYDIAVNEYNQTLLTALREVADQLATLHAVDSQLAAQAIAVKAVQGNYKLYHSRYNQGIADYAQLLQRKQLVLQQQALQLDLQTRHLQAVVAMLKALGGNDFISKDSG